MNSSVVYVLPVNSHSSHILSHVSWSEPILRVLPIFGYQRIIF